MSIQSPVQLKNTVDRCCHVAKSLSGPLIAAAILALAGQRGSAGEPGEVPAAKIDEIFARWDKTNSPGMVLAVIRDGVIVYQRGYGMANLEQDIPLCPTRSFTSHRRRSSSPQPAWPCWPGRERCHLTMTCESTSKSCPITGRESPSDISFIIRADFETTSR